MVDKAEFVVNPYSEDPETHSLDWPGGNVFISSEGLRFRLSDCEYDCDVPPIDALAFANAILKAYGP